MSDSITDREGWESSARGEAAWKAAKEDVAARNAEVRKAAKQQRQADDAEASRHRADVHRREMDDLTKTRRSR
jgi:hypothetical protein